MPFHPFDSGELEDDPIDEKSILPMKKSEESILVAAERAYKAYNQDFVSATPWEELNSTEVENWKRVVIAVLEYFPF